jgi:hypothetical protein
MQNLTPRTFSRSPLVRIGTATLLASLAALALALPRQFPGDSYQVQLQAVSDPAITIDGTTVQLAAGVLIFNANNATLVKGMLPSDVVVRVEFNGQCQVKRMWILKDEEIIHRSFWEWLTSGSFTPPCSS